MHLLSKLIWELWILLQSDVFHNTLMIAVLIGDKERINRDESIERPSWHNRQPRVVLVVVIVVLGRAQVREEEPVQAVIACIQDRCKMIRYFTFIVLTSCTRLPFICVLTFFRRKLTQILAQKTRVQKKVTPIQMV